MREQAYGLLLPVTDETRKRHPLVGDAYAVLWHSDNDMDDPTVGMNLVNKATATMLADNSTSAIVADVVKHYRESPLDDGNPAHRFFRNRLAEEQAETTG